MSKMFLSRIKPSQVPSSSSPQLRKLVHDTIHILQTNHQWQNSLRTHFDQSDVLVSDVAHLVLDRVPSAQLGLKFFHWGSQSPHFRFSNGLAYSSLLKLLARSRAFSEIEPVMGNMRIEEIKPTLDALSLLVRAHADSGLVDKALEFYFKVVEMYGRVPSVVACNSLLEALVKRRRFDVARKVYGKMLTRVDGEIDHVDKYSTSIIVKALCKEGRIDEGRKLIEDRWGEGCVPDVPLYNTLIDGYCKKGDVGSAYALLEELKSKGFLPTLAGYGPVVDGFCKEGNFKMIDRLLAELKERGLINVDIYNNVIDTRYKHGCAVEAVVTVMEMVENNCEPDLKTYNILIAGSCRLGRLKEASQLLQLARKWGLMPDKFSYTPLLHAYCKQGEHSRALDILAEMTGKGAATDLGCYTALIHGLVVAQDVDMALTIREKMRDIGLVPDAQIYNVLINGVCKEGRLSDAKLLLDEMLDLDIPPNAFVYTTLVDGLIRNGNLEDTRKVFDLAIEKGIHLDAVAYNAMIKGFCKFGMMKDALLCMNKMREEHHFADDFTYSTIIDGYVKQRDMDGALKVFGNVVKTRGKANVVTYTALINGFCNRQDFRGAIKTFKEMQAHGLEPNVVTYSIFIRSFCKEGKLAEAAFFFELMLMNKCLPDKVTFHYLVNGFKDYTPGATPNRMEESEDNRKSMFLDFLEMMISDGWVPSTAAYNSILICLCQYGMVRTALQLRDKMISSGMFLDSVSFASLLHGLCMEERSQEWKNIIPCDLNEQELQAALKYSLKMDQYFCEGKTSKTTLILQSLVAGYKSSDQEVEV
ncbi:hypothetical protein L484_025800 [Morus notabilis]|uniref:Pentacotripeptide-repeat region of PRORP domain-containing protein n=1 Tax=Morus notabilis TaxID=981085 RepID=W9R448_9ROSA|nr:pentatricopeptide repeat-containing protein At1g52620 [Morus notabilis]EXB67318.1 hypothetical protein L484_025800 [Morus notabilis]